ncbi:hypothetical protein EDC17_100395 [Sphingobacterium alimentarium]|uniref:TraB family protein n=1 Tax=Sphingobacterium alimentarium TaxID=797292 RepID=A0A4R3VZF6_9SPHI|nr:TraB/GumN family protein [Sphingobacterium alimentarium]TCV19996.1 hypothetical protein EDC17_100395 [Sphingobacterium alimentarium]
MKKLISLFVFVSFLTLNSFGQEQSLLWKISGNNLNQDSYLFGTIHMMCPEDFVMLDKVKNAIEAADEVIFEVNLFDPENATKMQESMMAPVPEFFNSLTADQIHVIDSVLAANAMSIQMFDMFSPSMVMSLLSLKSFNCPDIMNVKSMEVELFTLAQEKKISDLETLEFQMDMMRKIATPEYFYAYLNMYNEASASTQEMVHAYKTENLSELDKIMNDPKWMTPEVRDMMLTQRNLRWVEAIPSKIANTKTFIAVGSGHLGGETGLIKLLRDKGYTVTPIQN